MASFPSHIDNSRAIFSFFFFIFQVLILWSSICYLIWICLIPKTPHYTITSVHLLLPNHTSYSTTPNASLILQLEVSNPNKGISIYSASGNMSYWFLGVSDTDLENPNQKEFLCNIGNMSRKMSYSFPRVSDTKRENTTEEPCDINITSRNLSCWFSGVSDTKCENATEEKFLCNTRNQSLRNVTYWFPGVWDTKCENSTTTEEEFPCNVGKESMQGFYEGYKGNFTLGLDVNLGKVFWCWGRFLIDGRNIKDMKMKISLKSWVRFKYRIFKTVSKKHLIEMEAYVPVALDGRKVENLRIELHNIEKNKS